METEHEYYNFAGPPGDEAEASSSSSASISSSNSHGLSNHCSPLSDISLGAGAVQTIDPSALMMSCDAEGHGLGVVGESLGVAGKSLGLSGDFWSTTPGEGATKAAPLPLAWDPVALHDASATPDTKKAKRAKGASALVAKNAVIASKTIAQCTTLDSPQRAQLLVLGVPSTGAKSRVETQIKITLALVHDVSQTRSGYNLGLSDKEGELVPDAQASLERVANYTHLRLPSILALRGDAAAKGDKRKGASTGPVPPENVLNLDIQVISASNPGKQVYICKLCRQREVKRAQRTRDTKAISDADLPEEEARKRVVVFNSPSLIEFTGGEAVLPTRITCYCRHHKEKQGFILLFTLTNATGETIAQGMSPPILITDDHKTKAASAAPSAAPSPASNARASSEDTHPVKRAKRAKRTRETDRPTKRTSVHRSPSFAMTPLGAAAALHPPLGHTPTAPHSSYATPTPVNMGTPAGPAGTPAFDVSWLGGDFSGIRSVSPATTTSPGTTTAHSPTPGLPGSDTGFDGRGDRRPSGELLDRSAYSTYSPNTDYSLADGMTFSPPRSLSPSALGSAAFDIGFAGLGDSTKSKEGKGPTSSYAPDATSAERYRRASAMGLAAAAGHSDAAHADPGLPDTSGPTISRLIPAEGPVHGGIEVTILGSGFTPDLVCMFGDSAAVPTHLWSPNTLVCVLPPASTPGPVVVSTRRAHGPAPARDGVQLFTYRDDSDRSLLELALQVVGLKMTGKLEDAAAVAARIVGSGPAPDLEAALYTSAPAASFEQLLMSLLGLLDVWDGGAMAASGGPSETPRDTESGEREHPEPLDPLLSHATSRGHTLLHLATVLGFHRLAYRLVMRGIDLKASDYAGYTALHFAALHGRVAVARLLVRAGASRYARTYAGKTALDIARERDDIDVETVLRSAQFTSQLGTPMRMYQPFSAAAGTRGPSVSRAGSQASLQLGCEVINDVGANLPDRSENSEEETDDLSQEEGSEADLSEGEDVSENEVARRVELMRQLLPQRDATECLDSADDSDRHGLTSEGLESSDDDSEGEEWDQDTLPKLQPRHSRSRLHRGMSYDRLAIHAPSAESLNAPTGSQRAPTRRQNSGLASRTPSSVLLNAHHPSTHSSSPNLSSRISTASRYAPPSVSGSSDYTSGSEDEGITMAPARAGGPRHEEPEASDASITDQDEKKEKRISANSIHDMATDWLSRHRITSETMTEVWEKAKVNAMTLPPLLARPAGYQMAWRNTDSKEWKDWMNMNIQNWKMMAMMMGSSTSPGEESPPTYAAVDPNLVSPPTDKKEVETGNLSEASTSTDVVRVKPSRTPRVDPRPLAQDKMLLFFWLPILILALGLCFRSLLNQQTQTAVMEFYTSVVNRVQSAYNKTPQIVEI